MGRPKGSVKSIPSYRLHKPTGAAVVTIAGRDYRLGPHGTRETSPESWEKYDRVVGEYLVGGRRTVETELSGRVITVTELCAAFWLHAQTYYPNEGTRQGLVIPIRALKARFGSTPVSEFGSLRFKAIMLDLANQKDRRHGRNDKFVTRKYVNAIMKRIRLIFAWGVETEIVPAAINHAIQAVRLLQKGHTTARETPKVESVPEEYIEAVRPHLTKPVRAMLELQLLTGMRPGEVCKMRTCDISTVGRVWRYSPEHHKSENRCDSPRTVRVGPRAQQVLLPWLKPDLNAYIFSPRESEIKRNAERTVARQQKSVLAKDYREKAKRVRADTSNPDAKMLADALVARAESLETMARRKKQAGTKFFARFNEHYTPATYLVSIREAIDRANKLEPDRPPVPYWHPHQLRHNCATKMQNTKGPLVAKTVLGHQKLETTQIYCDEDEQAADAAILELG